jgi:hypothetical protein
MDPHSIHDALAQVREVRQRVIERERFLGYSAGGRFIGGALTLVAAFVMSRPFFPQAHWPMLAGWTLTAILASAINYGLCLRWYVTLPSDVRHPSRLYPLVDSLPPLLLAAAVTGALAWRGQFDLLFGAWMGLFGLVNFYSWHHLPRSIRSLGMFYLCCGILFLFHPGIQFLNPWPMAFVYVTGETVGGLIVRQNALAGRLWPAMPRAAAPDKQG